MSQNNETASSALPVSKSSATAVAKRTTEEKDALRRPAKKVKLEDDAKTVDGEDGTTAFKDCNIALAVDVSGSTKGLVLEAEQHAMNTICSGITQLAKEATKVVPWSDRIGPAIPVQNTKQIVSGGKTIPSMLCSSTHSISALLRSSLWFLMTDGLIKRDEVHRFANAVPKIQLHGTACVIIIFGRRPNEPKDINVSVGYSMFAVAPHSLILFHDIYDDEVYAIRAKGCFESLIPEDADNSDADTEWAKVPQIAYRQFATLRIPKPLPLSTNHIALFNGDVINMDDLLNDKVPRERSAGVISSDRDREAIVGSFCSRGQAAGAIDWLQRHQSPNDEDLNGSVSLGLAQQEQSENNGYSSLDGLSASRINRGLRLESNLSTASTLVETEPANTSMRTAVGEEED